MARDITTRVHIPTVPPEYAGERADFEKFVAYMNRKAGQIGMTQSHFEDAAGMDSLTTPLDLLKLMVYAKQNPVLDKVWMTKTHTLFVEGENARQMDCVSKSTHPDLDTDYLSVGKKGGTMDSTRLNMWIYNLMAFLEIPGSDDLLAVVVMYAPDGTKLPNNRFHATKQVADIAMALRNDPNADILDMPVCCENAIAALVPADGTEYTVLYEKNADALGRPMSISKVLTAVCILDLVKDLQEKITYHPIDTHIGGFYIKDYLPGDIVTYEDALYALMLESSNVTAQAMARCAGKKI